MARNAKRKDHAISIRFSRADIAMIDCAAGARGCTRAEFVREAAVRAAEDIQMENRPIRMSVDGFNELMAVLSAPPAAIPDLTELMKRPAPWERRGISKN